jgi:hypothetical protein
MKRFETRLTPAQRTALRAWWKNQLEGGGARAIGVRGT